MDQSSESQRGSVDNENKNQSEIQHLEYIHRQGSYILNKGAEH